MDCQQRLRIYLRLQWATDCSLRRGTQKLFEVRRCAGNRPVFGKRHQDTEGLYTLQVSDRLAIANHNFEQCVRIAYGGRPGCIPLNSRTSKGPPRRYRVMSLMVLTCVITPLCGIARPL